MISRFEVVQNAPVRILDYGLGRQVSITVQNVGTVPVEVTESGVQGTGFPLVPGGEYTTVASGLTRLYARTDSATPGMIVVTRTIIERLVQTWSFKGPVDDMTIARLPFAEGQEHLRGPSQGSALFATCEWHGAGPAGDPERPNFAVVDEAGPLAGLVGERVAITHHGKTVYAYVHRSMGALDAEMSVTRRLFLALAPLSVTSITVIVKVVG